MEGHYRRFKKSILAIVICMLLTPACVVCAAGRNTSVTGGAAGIGRDENGAISISLPTNNSVSPEIDPAMQKNLSGKILDGVFVEDVDLSGLSYEEAVKRVASKVDGFGNGQITLTGKDDAQTTVSAAEMGMFWDDKDTIADAIGLGKEGSIIERYKTKKDLEHQHQVYDLKIGFDEDAIRSIVNLQADRYDIEPVNATLSKNGDHFDIIPGTTGYVIDVESSVRKIMKEMADYRGGVKTIALDVVETDPNGSAEELEKIHDLLGTFTTSFSTSSADRSGNVRNGCAHINGTVLLPGEQFSTYETVSPFTEENGYFLAGSYLNGMVVESLGGGICQVSSTLYNAVLRAELEVNERYNHSMIVTYVKMSSDAAISGTSKDFKFTNSTDYPIYIEGITTDDKKITFNIYGVETRPANRTLEFESVELSKEEPVEEKIIADGGQPLGYISVQSAHTGYSGEFWKIVKVDGVETERVQINKSHYQATPKTATVGTATDNPAALAAIQSAMATGSIDFVRSTISSLNSAAAAAVAGGI